MLMSFKFFKGICLEFGSYRDKAHLTDFSFVFFFFLLLETIVFHILLI